MYRDIYIYMRTAALPVRWCPGCSFCECVADAFLK